MIKNEYCDDRVFKSITIFGIKIKLRNLRKEVIQLEKNFNSFKYNILGNQKEYFSPSLEREINKFYFANTEASKLPRFSIIMPVYNRKFCLANAIESVLAQTYKLYELIIIDDGSTDGSEDFIKTNYKDELQSGLIKYIKQENKGAGSARNTGLKNSSNEWICYVDSDNAITENFLETFAISILENENALCFYCRFINIKSRIIGGESFNYNKLIVANHIDMGTFVHHISVYKQLGGFNEKLKRFIDWDLILKYTKNNTPVFINKILLLYNDFESFERISNTIITGENQKYLQENNTNESILGKNDKIKITTLITTYNHENFIAEAINSAIKQKGFFEHEIIILNDASQDNTQNIINEYAKKYPDLIKPVENKKNIGISQNMKNGFKLATGKYIAILEGDDIWTDEYNIQNKMDFLEKNQDCSMVFSTLCQLYDNTNSIVECDFQKNFKNKLKAPDWIYNENNNPVSNFSLCMFNAKYMKSLPEILFDKYRFSEIPLVLYLEKFSYIGYINKVMSLRRVHDNNVWESASMISKLKQSIKVRKIGYKVCDKKYKKQMKKIIKKLRKELYKHYSDNIFSVKQENVRKVITVLGIKIKLTKRKNHIN